jgi:hypothetical protein
MKSGDEIWEHKKGRVWLLVKKLERENKDLRYQVKVLQTRLKARGPSIV